MTQTIIIEKENEVYIRLLGEPSVLMELNYYFRFRPHNYQFMPLYRAKKWDGYVYLYNMNNNRIYAGLKSHVKQFAEDRSYEVIDNSHEKSKKLIMKEFEIFLNAIPCDLKPRDYQLMAIKHAIDNKRALLVSPTGSGKSLIIYYLIRYFHAKKVLLIVPTISLVSQMFDDFENYAKADKNFIVADNVHTVFGGQEKLSDKRITITTWQSVYEQKKSYFEDYEVVIGDEAHLYKAKSLSKIMGNLVNAPIRIGTTGTLDGIEVHRLILQGHFGPIFKVTTTKTLIEKNMLSNFNIHCLVLNYSKELRKDVSKMSYQEEMDFIVSHEQRNKYICSLVTTLKGNTLILFQYVEKHGVVLKEMLEKQYDRNVYFVYGGTDAELRENVRKLVETETQSIIIASFGVYSTGVNIRNLHNIVFSSPSKSRIRTLQSIGRGLRKSETKESATLYDIADDFTHNERKNYTLNHFMERVKIYNEERFPYQIYNISMKA